MEYCQSKSKSKSTVLGFVFVLLFFFFFLGHLESPSTKIQQYPKYCPEPNTIEDNNKYTSSQNNRGQTKLSLRPSRAFPTIATPAHRGGKHSE
ncbi:uncharacterized protein BDW43DRAFT_277749 [Aspergillus alliaceus]|uniref:uncharacterized protein n=1 Tax=Petromyces alliaceus TaxID=209559 RepID=UPI0012A45498|nr:uncharacterized protein BDW43DRAFT_277749 [Aspergillus alliaceus]KAB8232873.1 hypothetical protein BDW43DRAFT_277749 [Aspergillus alliaceus]